MPTIDPERLLGDLYKLRTFGTYKTGVHRPSLSPQDVASRQWLAERMTQAGLEEITFSSSFPYWCAAGRKAAQARSLRSLDARDTA